MMRGRHEVLLVFAFLSGCTQCVPFVLPGVNVGGQFLPQSSATQRICHLVPRIPVRKTSVDPRRTSARFTNINGCLESQNDEFEVLESSVYTDLKTNARQAGTRWPDWDIALFPEYGIRGVVARKPIAEGASLIQAPLSGALVVSKLSACPFPESFAQPRLWSELKGHTARLTLYLLWEARKLWMEKADEHDDPSSKKWELYFECLKQVETEGNAVGWNEVKADPQNDDLRAKLQGIDAAARSEFELVDDMMSSPPELSLWLWARSSVAARTFQIPPSPGEHVDAYALVPMADFFNHEFGNTEVAVRAVGGGQDEGERVFELVTGRPFRAGEQVTISYGAMSNAELLLGYGFVDQDNTLDSVSIPLQVLKAAAKEVGPDTIVQDDGSNWKVAAEDLRVYKYGEDEQLMLCLKRVCGLEPPPVPEPSIEVQCLPWQILAKACELRLKQYPTSLEDDEDELDRLQALIDTDDGGAPGVALHTKSYSLVLYRALQKALLVECAERVLYFADKSIELGKLLQANVMEVQG